MKKKITLLSLACLLGFGIIAQENKASDHSHSIGIEFRKGDLNTIGLNYRKSYEKYNLKIGVFYGNSSINNTFDNSYFYETGDSVTPVISISPTKLTQKSAQTIQIGLERKVPYTGIDILLGADLFFGHRIHSKYAQVGSLDKIDFIENGYDYYRYDQPNYLPFNDEYFYNQLATTYSYWVTGLNVNLGVAFDLGDHIQIIGSVNYRLQSMNHYSELFTYDSEEYKEHLPTKSGTNLFEVEFVPSIAVNYRF